MKPPYKTTGFLLVISLAFSFVCHSQDWAQLKRYQYENAELMKKAPEAHRIVLMGNSITEGWLNARPEFFKDKPYVNRGIGGQTTPQMLQRFSQDVLSLKPNAVVILAGINDIAGNTGLISLEETASTIYAMAELAHNNDIEVVLCSVLPAFDFPWRPGLKPAEKVVALNKMLKEYAENHGYVFIDYHSVMKTEANGLIEAYGYDGVHPNEKGYKVMEPLLEEGIKKALKNQP